MRYVDKKIAMQNLANSEKLFTKMAKSFIVTYKNAPQAIMEHISNNDINSLYNYISTIKKTSLNIGSSILYSDSSDLLATLEKGKIDNQLIEQIIYTIRSCIKELEELNFL